MTVSEFYDNLSELYPQTLSCEWDNDGLMCSPDTAAEVKRVLVALDCTLKVIKKAVSEGYDTVLTHHPMIFRKAPSVTPDTLSGGRIIAALSGKVSVISLHTRLDAGVGGVSDCLADTLGLSDTVAFGDDEAPTICRLGTVPETDGESFARSVKASLGAPYVTSYLCHSVHRVAAVGGSGGDFIDEAIRIGADTLVTGECGYNEAEDAAEKGLNVILAGHYYTEFPVTSHLAALARTMTGAEVSIISSNPAKTIK